MSIKHSFLLKYNWTLKSNLKSSPDTYIYILVCGKHPGDVASYYSAFTDSHSDEGVLELRGEQVPPDRDVHGGCGSQWREPTIGNKNSQLKQSKHHKRGHPIEDVSFRISFCMLIHQYSDITECTVSATL